MLITHNAASQAKRCDIAQKTALYYTEKCAILYGKMHYIAREIGTKEKEDMPFLTYPPTIDVD